MTPLEGHIIRYLSRHPSGLSADQMWIWLKSRRKDNYTLQDFEQALISLRATRIACTNGLWWIKDSPAVPAGSKG